MKLNPQESIKGILCLIGTYVNVPDEVLIRSDELFATLPDPKDVSSLASEFL